MKIKTLDGQAVLCEDPGCGKPAVYLFSQSSPAVLYTAYCDSHGLRFAERMRLALPRLRSGPNERGEEAIA